MAAGASNGLANDGKRGYNRNSCGIDCGACDQVKDLWRRPMIETLLGGLLGGAFRLAPEILKWLDRKGERGHELAMQD